MALVDDGSGRAVRGSLILNPGHSLDMPNHHLLRDQFAGGLWSANPDSPDLNLLVNIRAAPGLESP
jgi:hypothetical protein